MTAATFIAPEIEDAINHVVEATGTRREFVRAAFSCDYEGSRDWEWSISAPVRRFTTAKGNKRAPNVDRVGYGPSPMSAAIECVNEIRRVIEHGYGGSAGRVEIAD